MGKRGLAAAAVALVTAMPATAEIVPTKDNEFAEMWGPNDERSVADYVKDGFELKVVQQFKDGTRYFLQKPGALVKCEEQLIAYKVFHYGCQAAVPKPNVVAIEKK